MDRSWNPAATGITTAHWKLNENIVFDKMLVTKKAREEKKQIHPYKVSDGFSSLSNHDNLSLHIFFSYK